MSRHARRRPGRLHARTPGRTYVVAAVAIAALLFASVVTAFASGVIGHPTSPVYVASQPVSKPTPSPEPSPSPSQVDGPVSFTLIAGGDVIPHDPVLTSALRSGTYDFNPLMDDLDPWISGADLAICNMETPVAPPGTSVSGYPRFGGPPEFVSALNDAGWDGCSTASNHTVDRGWAGVVTTLDTFESYQMGAVGSARSRAESENPQIYKVREGHRVIQVAHIAWTYGLNGLPKPSGKPWAVNTFDADDADVSAILAQAKKVREDGADVVILTVHCCAEYQTKPTTAQRSIATQIAASGLVDLYIGHHAHVPSPIEKLPGGPNGDGMWAAFGLGNYISNQDDACCVSNTSNGLLMTATFTVALDGKVDVGVEWTAITVDRLDYHTMHVLAEVPGGVGTLTAAEVQARYDQVRAAVGDQAPERVVPPTALADSSFWIRRKPWIPGS